MDPRKFEELTSTVRMKLELNFFEKIKKYIYLDLLQDRKRQRVFIFGFINVGVPGIRESSRIQSIFENNKGPEVSRPK